MRPLLCLLLCFLALPAAARQDPAPVRQAVEAWLARETAGLPGQASFEVRDIDADNQLAPCGSFAVERPAGARPWGRTHVQVRCLETAGWRLHVPVQVHVRADYLISARPIAAGQALVAADLAARPGDLGELPAGILTDPALAVGRTAVAAIPAGRPLRADMLRNPVVLRQGQTVRVFSGGPGFAVASEGQALGDAAAGQVAKVRLGNGQVVSGIARTDGSVEVRY